jgi:hypothetical protein
MTTNIERVGRGFQLVAEGLGPFVDERMSAAAGTAGADWTRLLEARDEAKFGVKKEFDKGDPAVQLRVLTEEWRVFSKELSRAQQSLHVPRSRHDGAPPHRSRCRAASR